MKFRPLFTEEGQVLLFGQKDHAEAGTDEPMSAKKNNE